MKTIAAIEQVPARDFNVRVSADARWIDTADLTYEIHEPDEYAREKQAVVGISNLLA